MKVSSNELLNSGNLPQGGDGGKAYALADHAEAEGGEGGESGSQGNGGDGGDAIATARGALAVGGKGGRGGLHKGGAGMTAIASHPFASCYGGNGGESSQIDGRGGRGGEAHGYENLFPIGIARRARMRLAPGDATVFPGRGGDAPCTPQYLARRAILERKKLGYFSAHGFSIENHNVWYDRDLVPIDWLNAELAADGHRWRVDVEDDEYVFLDGTG